MTRPLTPADLYAMGDYIMEHGFDPRYTRNYEKCGCFLHAAEAIGAIPLMAAPYNHQFWPLMESVVGCHYSEPALVEVGWTIGCTEDAAAACYIAGDILACEQARRR